MVMCIWAADTNITNYNITSQEFGHIAKGFLIGSLKTEKLDDFLECAVKDPAIIYNDI